MKRTAGIVITGLVFGTLIAWSAIPRFEASILTLTPATRWFEIAELHVEDTRVGDSPRMRVERVIRRPVRGDWTTTVRRIVGEQHTTAVCSRHGVSDYVPGSVLPPDLTLDGWMAIPPAEPCTPLEPGRYRVTTVWQLHIQGTPDKEYRVASNIFTVRP